MLLDKQCEFSDSQVVTVTAISTNVYDLGPTNALKDIGGPEAVYLIVQTDTSATAAGAATMVASLESSTTADLATAPTVHVATGAFSIAQMTGAGTLFAGPLPAGAYKRYMGIRYTIATGPLTAGAFSAFLVRDAQAWRAYANGI